MDDGLPVREAESLAAIPELQNCGHPSERLDQSRGLYPWHGINILFSWGYRLDPTNSDLRDPIAIGLNFKCAFDSEKAFETSHCIKQEWKTNRNSIGLNLYGRFDREDDYTLEGAEGECL
ncbi:hypothetical protein CQW23_03566 [Capsicum baccatum]|uniref:Uncharacterized protein n=1 Tax=Capsicum baccatum TaxID=33114 RepID=A0A2G2XC77_CAPBA|nr:hypothetical protein CQW23_03566 [Capsicum baccatum]